MSDLVTWLSVAGAVASIVGIALVVRALAMWHRKRTAMYHVLWKSPRTLKPSDLLWERPFSEYYYERPEDATIRACLASGDNFLVLGRPLSGKTRAVLEALRHTRAPIAVLVPALVDMAPEEVVRLPWRLTRGRRAVVVFDDLHRFVDQKNFERLLRLCLSAQATIVATCRSGAEYARTRSLMVEKGPSIEYVFGPHIIRLGAVSEDKGREIADATNRNWHEVKFDGTIGSLFLPLLEMQRRFEACPPVESTVLRTIWEMNGCGAYEGRHVFPVAWLQRAARTHELEGKDYQWQGWLKGLGEKELLTVGDGSVSVEEAFLESIFGRGQSPITAGTCRAMLSALIDVPPALSRIGNRALAVAVVDVDKADYARVAIAAFEEALKAPALERTPTSLATTQNSLGNAYQVLAEAEDKAVNCKKAIAAYGEALKVRTLERLPMDYAMTQNNLGAVYRSLAEAENKAVNCRNAIAAFAEALKVHTLEHSPIGYAMIQNNLGAAYGTLAQVEDQAANCKKAIAAYGEALKVNTLERLPMDYAATQSNLGNAYQTLADVEDKAANCKKAIAAYGEALKVHTLERLPADYAITQNNLGAAYRVLAEAEDRAVNCAKAGHAIQEALRVLGERHLHEVLLIVQDNLARLREVCRGNSGTDYSIPFE